MSAAKHFLIVTGLALTVALLPSSSAAQDAQCSDERSHQFDFWIGEWEVFSGDQLAGTNGIRQVLDGCVLHENWIGAGGNAGSSFNFYNPQTKKWQQFWVWRNGTTLELEGGYEDGKMILAGESIGPKGNKIHNRITWYDNADGTVRQHWEISKDRGKNWETAFDGLYRQKG